MAMRADAARHRVAPGAAALAVLVAGGPAAGQDRPVFPPVADVAVTYRVHASQQGVPPSVVLRYSAAADRFRLDAAPSAAALPGYVVVDHKARRATIVMEPLGLVMEVSSRAGLGQAFLLEDARQPVRRGTAKVAGLPCTLWDIAGPSASGTACITDSGVVLRAEGHDDHGRTGRIEATHVDPTPQDAALFTTPAGLRRAGFGAANGEPAVAGMLSGPRPGLDAVLDRLRGPAP